MKYVNISAFKKLTQAGIATLSNDVINLMSNNPIFSGQTNEVKELRTRTDAYMLALTNCSNGGRIFTLEKDKCLTSLLDQLTILAFQVDILSNGDEVIILAAGFTLRKTPTSYTFLPPPNVIYIENEKATGVVKIQLAKVEGATNYGIEKRIIVDGQPSGPWMNGEYTSACSTKINNLQTFVTYEFRFRALGSKGLVSEWSSIVSVRVS